MGTWVLGLIRGFSSCPSTTTESRAFVTDTSVPDTTSKVFVPLCYVLNPLHSGLSGRIFPPPSKDDHSSISELNPAEQSLDLHHSLF